MKGYERRAAGMPDFYKLASWDVRNCCWNDGKRQYDSQEQAKSDATVPGRYRISFVADGKPRVDLEPFEV